MYIFPSKVFVQLNFDTLTKKNFEKLAIENNAEIKGY